jgi:molecular chaperone DnaK
MDNFIGIDLGTTFSVVAYIDEKGSPQTIANEFGEKLTPSVIYLGGPQPVVGKEAKENQASGATEIASFFKREMGEAYFELEFNGQVYTPVDLSALVLKKLKETAETFLHQPVTHAVITVPAYFTDARRKATIEAGKKAGLDVLAIINEPTAAALAYGIKVQDQSQTIIVYDLGGGTFDVTLLKITPTEQRVLGTDGDHRLGGKDWDDRLFNYFCHQFEEEYGTKLVGDDYNELLVQSEKTKRTLSAKTSASLTVQAEGKRGTYTITRAQFEEMTADLMARTRMKTESLLHEVNMSWQNVDQVLLVGGSTRMPMVPAYIQQMTGKAPLSVVNPDEAVALGAAVYAAQEMNAQKKGAPLLTIGARRKSVDVMSHSLGMIAINEDGSRYINSIIVRKNEPIPASQARPYTLQVSRRNDQTCEVYMTQGELDDPQQVDYLGKYVFSDIPTSSDAKVILDITYAYDKNGVVNVAGVERSTRHPLSVRVEPLPPDVPARFLQPPQQAKPLEHLTVYMAFDVSGSMDGEPLREAAKAARAFASQCDLSRTSIGLISFSDSVSIDTEASQDAKRISRAIDDLTCGKTGYGNATDPFNEIGRLLTGKKGLRYAIVLADGVWSYQDEAIKKAQKCHANGIEVIGVGFGGADKAFLKAISSADQDSFFTDMNKLSDTFSAIAQELTEGRSASGLRSK